MKSSYHLHPWRKVAKTPCFFEQKVAKIPCFAVLECKSGEDPKDQKSLDAILRTAAIKISRAMVFCRENIMTEGPITYYPLYMAIFL